MIKSWSYSRYAVYQECPRKFKFKFIDKLPEPPSPALERGAQTHTIAENYIKGNLPAKVPTELSKFPKVFKELRKEYRKSILGCLVEESWNFRNDWTQTVWNDWDGCWLRIKTDCVVYEDDDDITVIDWKTGKFRPDNSAQYMEQLSLYALGGFLMLDHVEIIAPRLYYLDEGKVYPENRFYTRDDLPGLQREWLAKVKPMMSDKSFLPKPGNACRFCTFKKSNGGPCEY